MTDEELIAELREDAGRFGEAGETVWPGDVMLKAADAIERLTRERDDLYAWKERAEQMDREKTTRIVNLKIERDEARRALTYISELDGGDVDEAIWVACRALAPREGGGDE
jgi:hypothetical protein